MTFEIGAGAFTICAAALVFGLLSSTPSKHPHQTGKVVGTLLVVEKTPTPSIESSPSPTATPGAQLPLTAINPAIPSPSPTSSRPTVPTSRPQPSAPPSPADRAPVIVLAITTTAPLTVTVDASRSTDTDGTPIANVVFDFGDGTPSVPLSAGFVVTHTYASAVGHTITVTAIDTGGHVSTAVVTSVV